MPINWNQAEFVDPKLQIAPEQLPVEAAMKVGDVLQNRYDKAMETDTKIGALTKRLMGSSDPSDQALAKQISDTYAARLNQRKAQGDYQNMQWQTAADAEDFANIYSGLTTRAKEISDYEKSITNDKSVNSVTKAKWLKMYRDQLGSAKFDPENRFVSNLKVQTPSIAADIDHIAMANALGSSWKADAGGGETATYSISDGKTKLPGMDKPLPVGVGIKRTKAGTWEKVDENEMSKALTQAFKSNTQFQDVVARDLKLDLHENPLVDDETIADRRAKIENSYLTPATDFAKAKFGYNHKFGKDLSDIDGNLSSLGIGVPTPDPAKVGFTSTTTGVPIDVTKSVEAVDDQKKKYDEYYDANGNFVGKKLNYAERLAYAKDKAGWPGVIEQATRVGYLTDNNFLDKTDVVPQYFKDAYKGTGKTPKQIFDVYMANVRNNAKVSSRDYMLSSKDFRGIVENNVVSLISGSDLYNVAGQPVAEEDRSKMLSATDKTIKFNPYQGSIVITGNGSRMTTPLSSLIQGAPNQDLIQVQISSMQNVLKGAMDISNGTTHTGVVPTSQGNLHFSVVQPGKYNKSGKGVIVQYDDNNNVMKKYPLTEQGMQDYTETMLGLIIHDSNLGMQ